MKGDMMGTNYYLYAKPNCECCGRPFKPLHIGKSSMGWCFALHIIPEEGIVDLDDWIELWSKDGTYIMDEYTRITTKEEMIEIITNRSRPNKSKWTTEDYLYSSAEPGPNNLVRSSLSDTFCIKHGKGTWDCIVGEFS